jgi:predicted SpoU family rRNA methylase
MSVITQLYFQIVEEINYIFRTFSGWAIIRLRLEYRRKLIHYNVDIKNGGTRSHFTMFGEVRSYIYAMWNLHCLRLYLSCLL